MSFGMISWNRSLEEKQSYVTYINIAEDVETRFDASNYELDWLLPRVQNKNSNWIYSRWIRWKK